MLQSSSQNNKAINSSTGVSSIKQALGKENPRILNLNYALVFFFRKFYSLAHLRIKDLLEKLGLASKLIEASSSFSNPTITTPNLMSATNPIITPIQQTPIITNSFAGVSTNVNEAFQILLRLTWNMFEYAISTNKACLISKRHLDQMILCSIYIVCKCLMIKMQFHDIMKMYRLTWPKNVNKNYVYRKVLKETSGNIG
jgi:hypothetical protein